MAPKDSFTGGAASAYLKEAWHLNHSVSYLAWLRCRGGGPQFYVIGRTPHYTAADLDVYGLKNTGPIVSTTAEHRAAIAENSAAFVLVPGTGDRND
jgi:hypothetical protein